MPEDHTDLMSAAELVAKSKLRLARLEESNAPPLLLKREAKMLAARKARLKDAIESAPDQVPPRECLLGAMVVDTEVGGARDSLLAAVLLEAAYPEEAP